jgi:2-octaprenylphenol hydroxylase
MKAADSTDFDAIIVGGGMVGASLAGLLENTPLRLALVDQTAFDVDAVPCFQQPSVADGVSADQPGFDPRVSAITAASKNLFARMGIWNEIERARCCTYQDMEVWDADGTGSIHFSAADIKQAELGSIVENSLVSAALYNKLAKSPNLEILAPLAVVSLDFLEQEGEPIVQLQMDRGRPLRAKLIIAADGANSKIRQLANFVTREWDYNHHALVTTVRTASAHRHKALQRFIDTGPLAFLPLNTGLDSDAQRYCSIVWSMVPDQAQEVMSLSENEFRAHLAAAIEHRLGEIEWSAPRFSFPLRQRHAIDYVQRNIVLLGDAAHSIHPLAGQGVNLGLLDAAALAEELSRGLQVGRKLADPIVLQRYQRRRIGHNLGMMWLMEGFKHLFAEQALPVRWLRNSGMTAIDNIPAIKNLLARRAMGMDWF